MLRLRSKGVIRRLLVPGVDGTEVDSGGGPAVASLVSPNCDTFSSGATNTVEPRVGTEESLLCCAFGAACEGCGDGPGVGGGEPWRALWMHEDRDSNKLTCKVNYCVAAGHLQ